MALIKITNAQLGSDARYRATDAASQKLIDSEGRPLGAEAWLYPDMNTWTQGLPGAREGNAEGTGGGAAGGGGGIPGAAVYGQTAAQGLSEYKKALARLNQNRQNTLTQYGYAADIDPETGVMKNQRVDSSNPYGLYQNARRNNALQYLQLRDAASERRLGGRGLGAQGISDARFGWGAADTAMAQALTQTQSGYDQEQQSAWQAYQNLLWQLELEAARAAAANSRDWWDPGGSPDDIAGLNDPFTNAAPSVTDEWAKAAAVQNALIAKAGRQAAPVIPKSMQVKPNRSFSKAALNRIQAANRRK